MDPSAEELPKREIVRRTNALNLDTPQLKKEEPNKGSSLGSKAAALTLAGLAIGGTAAAIEKTQEGSTQANAVEAQGKDHTRIEEQPPAKIQEKVSEKPDLFETVFHDLSPQQKQEARAWVEDFKTRIKAKPGYEKEHRMIPEQYKEIIKDTAKAYGISEEMLYGIIAIENGGGPDVTNQISGAKGVAQFLPDTARQYGLIVNENQDQRADPVLSIDAAGRYLRDHQKLFNGDIGLTMWSYHAGVGNVYNAMRTYFLEEYDTDIGSYSGSIVANDALARQSVETKARELMKKDKLSFFKLVTNEAVKSEVISHLHDYSETYVPSILAILQLANETDEREVDLGSGLKIAVPKDAFPTSR